VIAALVYLSCALAALGCAILLLRGYGRTKARLLLWSGVCFSLLTLNNTLVMIDGLVFPTVDLSIVRQLTALAGISCMLWGLVWESR
jgi:hypothetical protein